MLLGPDELTSDDDPDAGLIEAATRILFVVVATGVAALVAIGLLGFVLLAVVDGLVGSWRRWREERHTSGPNRSQRRPAVTRSAQARTDDPRSFTRER